MAADGPTDPMIDPVRRVVDFQVSGDRALLDGVFTPDAEILDSFAPYLFTGPSGRDAWAEAFRAHVADHQDLSARLLAPQEFSDAGRQVFYSQPVEWTYGRVARPGGRVTELGSLAVLLVLGPQPGSWQVRRLAWAVALCEG